MRDTSEKVGRDRWARRERCVSTRYSRRAQRSRPTIGPVFSTSLMRAPLHRPSPRRLKKLRGHLVVFPRPTVCPECPTHPGNPTLGMPCPVVHGRAVLLQRPTSAWVLLGVILSLIVAWPIASHSA